MAQEAARRYVARAMGVVYGLMSAVLWGTADFLARLASERVGSRRTLFFMQCLAALCLSAVVAVPAAQPAWPSTHVVVIAIGLGLLNVSGGFMLYRALEIGTVSLVSPVSSTFAAIAALLAIGVAGERPSAWQLAGLGLCAAGVVAASIPPRRGDRTQVSRRGLGLAAGAAVCWGVSFFALRYVVKDLGPYFPVWISRLTSIVALVLLALVQRASLALPRGAWGLIVGVAVFDSGAFVSYNLGVATQLTAIVSILSSLFSAVTVMLAFIVLKERLGRAQWISVAIILAGVALVSSAV